MISLSPRERRIVLAALGVALLALFYQMVLEPFLKKWHSVSKEIRVTEVRLQKTQSLLGKEADLERLFKQYVGVSLEEKGGDEATLTAILQEVEAMAQRSGLKVLEMRPLSQRKVSLFQERGLEVSAEGSASQFAQFVYALLDSPHSLKIEKLELYSKSEQDPLLRGILVVSVLTR